MLEMHLQAEKIVNVFHLYDFITDEAATFRQANVMYQTPLPQGK